MSEYTWEEYYRLRALVALSFAFMFVAAGIAGWIGVSYFGSPFPGFVTLLAAGSLYFYFAYRFAFWKCPRCPAVSI